MMASCARSSTSGPRATEEMILQTRLRYRSQSKANERESPLNAFLRRWSSSITKDTCASSTSTDEVEFSNRESIMVSWIKSWDISEALLAKQTRIPAWGHRRKTVYSPRTEIALRRGLARCDGRLDLSLP